MIIGAGFIILAFPIAPMSMVEVGPIVIRGVSQFSSTRIAVGLVLLVVGYFVYKKR